MRLFLLVILFTPLMALSQLKWKNVDSLFGPLPSSVHVYYTNDSMYDGKPNIAYYVVADLKDKKLKFTTDTSSGRRLTPSEFYNRNNKPCVVVNCTFFEFVHNSNLNLVVRKGKLLAGNQQSFGLKGKDTLKYAHVFPAALGITKKREADVAYTFTTAAKKYPFALQQPMRFTVDSSAEMSLDTALYKTAIIAGHKGSIVPSLTKWKMQTAVGGGPVLLQRGEIKITNNEERKFAGKAINDKHPRTAMGYTKDGKLIILVLQGRFPNVAEGASLTQEAQILKELGCEEALNLDGGGSSCLLVNGKTTIAPSDKVQRAVPAVFIIK